MAQQPGLTGLQNLGNSCYINAVLQCLSHLNCLKDYFCQNKYKEDINRSSNSTRGHVAEEFGKLICELWNGEHSSIACRALKAVVGQHHKPFCGNEQQDAQEFLAFLFELIHNDLKKEDSIMVKTFYIEQVYRSKSSSCFTLKYEPPTPFLTIELPTGAERCSLEECLELYTSKAKVIINECDECHGLHESDRSVCFCRLPPSLIFHLKRFTFDGVSEKLETIVDFSLDDLDMNMYTANSQQSHTVYDLCCVTRSKLSKPPLEVWELLRNPILEFYKEGMDSTKKIEGVIAVINNSCRMRKNWYIPVPKANSEQESYSFLEEQHTAFCTWLLGRLFCIPGRDSLVDIHSSCVEAQTEVLEVCAENRFMSRFFFNEYVLCLTDLFTLQTSESVLSNGSHLLKRFTPLPIQSLEEQNLTPKYILLKSQSLINNFQKYLVQILDSMVPSIVLLYEDLLDKYWLALCKLLQVATLPLKLDVLKSFSKIISVAGCYNKMALAELCHTLKYVTESVPSQLLVESESEIMQNILTSVGDLVNVIVSVSSCLYNVPRSKDLLTILHSVIFLWKLGKEGTCLNIACKNVLLLIDALPQEAINPENFCFLLNRFRKLLLECNFDNTLSPLLLVWCKNFSKMYL